MPHECRNIYMHVQANHDYNTLPLPPLQIATQQDSGLLQKFLNPTMNYCLFHLPKQQSNVISFKQTYFVEKMLK